MHELRKDPVTGRWVIIAAQREERPNQFRRQAVVDASTPCPFCAGQMRTPPIVASYGASNTVPWQVCVVPNLYPILRREAATLEEPVAAPVPGPHVLGMQETAAPTGMHEVVIEAPTHVTSMGQLSAEQVHLMLTAYRDRMQVMRDEPSIAFAMPFKNVGPDAGASLEHSHSQLVGLPFVPPFVAEELAGAERFFGVHGSQCVFCHLVREEAAGQLRVVAETAEFLAWCPFASRFSMEVWIAPRTHLARFETSPDSLLEKLGDLLRLVVRMLESHPKTTAFNLLLHSTPFDIQRDDHYHWHIEIIPRIAKTAGMEWGTGIHIISVTPEDAAVQLRGQAKNYPFTSNSD